MNLIVLTETQNTQTHTYILIDNKIDEKKKHFKNECITKCYKLSSIRFPSERTLLSTHLETNKKQTIYSKWRE